METVERIIDLAPASLSTLDDEGERSGLRFVRRLTADWASGTNRFDRPGEALYAARINGEIVGACGLNVDPYTAEGRVGRVRHLYVLEAYRRHGVGRQLVAEVIGAARRSLGRLQPRPAQ